MGYQQADCYFSVEVQPRMNNIFVELFLPDGMSSQAFEDVVGKMSFQRESGKILLRPQLNNQDRVQKNIAKFLLLMLSSSDSTRAYLKSVTLTLLIPLPSSGLNLIHAPASGL